mmetsp:Transcript_40876/g.100884  ORF Transcript_40876/g.100884 Transcript_40876/m.100884 type:complete len:220 (+) Transcript_40876:852-1511(+)
MRSKCVQGAPAIRSSSITNPSSSHVTVSSILTTPALEKVPGSEATVYATTVCRGKAPAFKTPTGSARSTPPFSLSSRSTCESASDTPSRPCTIRSSMPPATTSLSTSLAPGARPLESASRAPACCSRTSAACMSSHRGGGAAEGARCSGGASSPASSSSLPPDSIFPPISYPYSSTSAEAHRGRAASEWREECELKCKSVLCWPGALALPCITFRAKEP